MEQTKHSDQPFKETAATQMLHTALQRAAKERGLSTRAAARELGYKATVVISHMATGRVPIPLERAVEIAQVVGLDPPAFYAAVLEQRYPGSSEMLGLANRNVERPGTFVSELTVLAGCGLEELPEEHRRILREVVSERAPARRWLSIAELPTVLALRRLRPDMSKHGLTHDDIVAIRSALD
jgi:hypothetical protein